MDWYIWIIIGFAIIIGILYALKWLDNKLPNKLPYVLQGSLLTERELAFYKKLKPISDELQLVICPKVRLADIVKVHNAGKEKQTYFNKIQSKHIDFVLCDSEMKIKLLIELDDRSHQQKNRQQSDTFKNELAKQVGVPIVRIKSINEDIKTAIAGALQPPAPELAQESSEASNY